METRDATKAMKAVYLEWNNHSHEKTVGVHIAQPGHVF